MTTPKANEESERIRSTFRPKVLAAVMKIITCLIMPIMIVLLQLRPWDVRLGPSTLNPKLPPNGRKVPDSR